MTKFINKTQNKGNRHFKYWVIRLFFPSWTARRLRDWTWNHIIQYILAQRGTASETLCFFEPTLSIIADPDDPDDSEEWIQKWEEAVVRE